MRTLLYLISALLWLSVTGNSYAQQFSFRSSDAELNSIYEASREKMQELTSGSMPIYMQIASEQAMLEDSVADIYSAYIEQIKLSQGEDGGISVAPFMDRESENEYFDLAVGTIFAPWYRYIYGGDDSALRSSYQMMRLWLSRYRNASRETYGNGEDDNMVSKYSLSSIYYYGALSIMRDIAKEIGRKEDAGNFTHLANVAKEEFNRSLVKGGGASIGDNSTTTLALAHYYDILTPQNRDLSLRRLISGVKDRELNIGIHGVKALLTTLSDNQEHELAYSIVKELFNSDDSSKLLYVVNGWLYRYVVGIRATLDGAGFRSVIIEPMPLEDIANVEASVSTPYGDIISFWERRDDGYYYATFTIPTGCAATIILPNGFEERVGDGVYHRTW